jgi:hypothetical protein
LSFGLILAKLDFMKQKTWARLSIMIWPEVGLMLLFAFALFFFLGILNAHPDPNFWFVPLPPVPPYAINVENLDGGSLGGSRMIQFETGQSAEKIRQFYQAELPKHGWHYQCSATELDQPGCPLVLSPSEDLADNYQCNRVSNKVCAIDVIVYKPGENVVGTPNRLVQLMEYRYSPGR